MSEFAAHQHPVNIEDEMKRSYMDYAMSVIIGRALPDARDGLKPAHRRVLYGMKTMGLSATRGYRKCAKIVGEVMGNFHPHGDASIYDTLVRLAQDFNMRYPSVDGQGNFGSIDGDPPAAMRYTEARLKALADDMMADLDKETVDFTPNYDETTEEPTVLPAPFPNLLVNGSAGIAVGMATNIPPHNLREVVDGCIWVIEHTHLAAAEASAALTRVEKLKQMLRLIPGPDFPTAGYIVGRQGIVQAYMTGRGSVMMRAKSTTETNKKGDRISIVITEIPYQVNKAKLIERIADLVREKVIEGISDLRDESDRDGMRIVIELKRDARVFTVLNNLYKHTTLQTTFGVIMLAIVDGRPSILSLKQALQLFIDHRRSVILRRTRFDLERAQERAHILEGLKICLDHLDEVIKTIRAAADPDIASTELQTKFGLSDRQAKAVLALTLSRLTRLERGKIDAEYEEVIKTIAYLESVLASDQKVRILIKDEMDDLAKKYGDDRRTEITDQEASELSAEDLVPKEEVVVTLTHRGYVKRQPLRVFRAQKRGGVGLKGAKPTAGSDAPSGTREEDYALHLLTTHTHASMLFFTQSGRVFQLRVHEVPERERQAKGVPVNNLIDIDSNERITALFVRPETEAEARYMLMVTKNGYIKKTALAEYANVRRNGLIAINLQEGDELDWVTPTTGSDEILIATELGKAIRFSETEVRAMGRDTQGVIGIKLGKGDAVAGMATATPGGDLLVITQRGYGKRTPVSEYPMHHRAGQGVFTLKVTDRVGKLTAMRVVSDPEEEVLVISASGMVLRTPVGAISRIGRQTQGVIVMRIAPDDQIVAIAPVAAIEDEDVKE